MRKPPASKLLRCTNSRKNLRGRSTTAVIAGILYCVVFSLVAERILPIEDYLSACNYHNLLFN